MFDKRSQIVLHSTPMVKAILAVVGLAVALGALAGNAATPRSLSYPVAPPESVAKVNLPALDMPRLLEEDRDNQGRDVPYRIGSPLKVDLKPSEQGSWETLADGGRIWRLRVQSPGALWLSLVFDGFALPAGAELYIYASDGSGVAGPFTARDARDYRILATPLVPGDTTVAELFFPCGVEIAAAPAIETVVVGYKELPRAKESGFCEVDVNCPEGAAWQAEKRAVALIYFLGYICTGTLLNDVPQDCRNYFLTAHHCISKKNEAEAAIFYWNYEAPTCGGGDGDLGQFQTGSTLKATKAKSDFTLLELSAKPEARFNVYYAGWTNSAMPASQATGIHHPAGDVKKISLEYSPLVDGSYYGSNHWRVTRWDVGVTEGGSSGSGLWNQDHRLVGQLHGGASACGNPDDRLWDEYGKFNVSWFEGGKASKKLRKALDPSNTGATGVPGKESSSCP